ncbi:MAG: BACON domain-containing protein [Bacteroidales bacterium]|nr:BACON domain-containing protein [Bacteroidales bacterium]
MHNRIFIILAVLCLLPFSCSKPDAEGTSADSKDSQEKQEPTQKENPFLTLSVSGDVTLPAQNASLTVEVSTNLGGFEVRSRESWVSVSAQDAGSFTLSLQDNPDFVSRRSQVTVYAPKWGAAEDMQIFSVVQEAAQAHFTEVPLDGEGTSNAYLIGEPGLYSFSARVRGNGKTVQGLSAPSALSPSGAKLVWQSSAGFISEVSLKDGRILFTAKKTAANAVIAATDATGTILWSWHVWAPGFAVKELPTESGDVVMHVNLGATSEDYATSVGAYGLLYQWGRKDPFPGSPVRSGGTIYTKNIPVYGIDGKEVTIGGTSMNNTTNNTLQYAIANPSVCIANNAQQGTTGDWLRPGAGNDAFWGNPSGDVKEEGAFVNQGSKTYYDPCPLGWRVPSPRVFQHFTQSGGYTWATGTTTNLSFSDLGGECDVEIVDMNGDGVIGLEGDYADGWWFYTKRSSGAYAYFPATTRYDGGYGMFMGSMAGYWANYWYNAPGSSYGEGRSLAMSFQIHDYGNTEAYTITLSPLSGARRADAYAVRCQKE